jgi:plastocyanin
MRTFTLAAVACGALLAGCGGDESGSASTAVSRADTGARTTIRIRDFVFDPSPATVRAGQTISVANDDTAPHTLTEQPASGRPLFDTGTVRGRQTGSFTVTKPGTYTVVCELHPFMKGEIAVLPR